MSPAPQVGELDLAAMAGGNPFDKEGLSDEVRAILAYLLAARAETGVDVVVTSTTDHKDLTASGNPSRHRIMGTNGRGLALDCALRRGGDDVHQTVFDLFGPVELSLHELIYAGAEHNIKGRRRVPPFAVKDHHNHVHVSVDVGTFLQFPGQAPADPTIAEEEDMTPEQAKHLKDVVDALGRIEVVVRDPASGMNKRLDDLTAKVDQLMAQRTS